MFALATAALLTLGLVQAQVKTVVLDPVYPYTLTYTILNENSTNPTFQATLDLKNYMNTTSWKTDGRSGVYVALGYNTKVMALADVTFCSFLYFGRANDSFTCYDINYDLDRVALFTERTDVKNVKTVIANKTSGQFTVSYERAFLSNETGKDSNLTLGVTPFIWSYGSISNAWPDQHGNSNYGDVTINVQTGEKVDTSFSQTVKVSLLAILSVVILFF